MSVSIQNNKQNPDIIRKQIIEIFSEILSDPDFGLEINRKTSERLNKSVKSKKANKFKPLKLVLEKYSLQD